MATNNLNAASHSETIFSPDGTPTTVSRLNAHDLIRANGYTWFAPKTKTAVVFDLPEATPVNLPEEFVADALTEDAAPPVFDINESPLDEIVFAMVGTSDISKYLEGFSPDALRVMAEARYGARLHHRSSKETLIAKIVELEAEKTSKESTAQE